MRYFAAILSCLMLLGLATCQKEKINEDKLIGEWPLTAFTITKKDSTEMGPLSNPNYDATATLSFKPDGNFEINLDSEAFTLYFTGTWLLDGAWITLVYEGEDGLISTYLTDVTVTEETYHIAALTDSRLGMTAVVGLADVALISQR